MKYNKTILILTTIAIIISFMLGISYAYFSIETIGNETASTQLITTANLRIKYQGTDTINTDNMEPGDTTSTTFTVKNTGSVPVNNYQVYFSNVINQIINDEMVYTLTCVSDDTNPCEGKLETAVPTEASPALTQASIAPGTTHTYTLTVTYKDTDSNQDYNQKKLASFKITINEQYGFGILVARQSYTSNVTNMGSLFDGCSSLTELNLTNFDTSKTTDMSYMFKDCTNLTNVDLSTFNTYNVTNMSGMFGNCNSLTSFDLSVFITNNLIKIGKETDAWSLGLFENCANLNNIDFRNASFEKVTDYLDAFANVKNGINIIVKDSDAQTFINARLSDAGKTGNVTIYVP